MKRLIIHQIKFLSRRERKARTIKFDPKQTIIMGGNDTGKSSLLKSIYYTFGTETKFNDVWKTADIATQIEFSVDGKTYNIIRDKKVFALINANGDLTAYQSVTNGIGIKLAELFDFKLRLSAQSNELITPPPAYLFLPFYVDQDLGWNKNWNSFNNLQQIKDYRSSLINYHSGIHGNVYYETKNKIESYNQIIKELETERKVSKVLLEKLKDKTTQFDFNISIGEFQNEVHELLDNCTQLKKKQDEHKSKLVDLQNEQIALAHHLKIAKQALLEVKKDYEYAVDELQGHSVDCPTCGAFYENSFAERLEIAKDENRCMDLIVQINGELIQNKEKITTENSKYQDITRELLVIESLLEIKKGDIKLKDLIENQGKSEIKKVFSENIASLLTGIADNARELQAQKEKLKSIDDKNHKDKIQNLYKSLIAKFVFDLNVVNWKSKDYQNIQTYVKETGSALPRALISYFYAILHVMNAHSTSTFCPIIIDSPNQQALDKVNRPKTINFIMENQPSNSQLIMSLV